MLDAIPLLKTDGGIALMAELFKAGGITESTLDIWFSTLPFYKNPSRSMVGSVLVSVSILPRHIINILLNYLSHLSFYIEYLFTVFY